MWLVPPTLLPRMSFLGGADDSVPQDILITCLSAGFTNVGKALQARAARCAGALRLVEIAFHDKKDHRIFCLEAASL